MVFVELLAAAGAGCPCECHSIGYARICGNAAGFGVALYLAGRDADGPAIARCRATAVAGGAVFCSGDQSFVFPFALHDEFPFGRGTREAAPWPETRRLDRWIPRGALGAAAASIGMTIVIGSMFTVLGTEVLKSYGWGLFVALPFCLGLFSVLVYGYHEPRTYSSCIAVSLVPIALLGAVLLLVMIEGVICILMAAPFALALGAFGGMLGYAIQAGYWLHKGTPATLMIVLLFTPAFQGVESWAKPQAGTFEVRTAIEVNAPPEKVWNQVVAFAEIPPPTELLFRAGIAYPIRAEISGHGVGAVRHCIFSTGPFAEPIEVWDEPRLLKFGVTANPAPLNEISPYGNIQPPHLHGYFVSEKGQFSLTVLPGGRTRLEGTTWYQHTMWPAAYWHLWSDYIIHRIHLRVLEHIRAEAERN